MDIDNTFTHDHAVYSLDIVRRLVRQERIILLPIRELLWVLDYDKPSEDRIKKAQHRHPLLVAKWNGRWTVIDGLHRLEKYRRKGIKMIPVREVSQDILRRALIPRKSILNVHRA